MRKYRYITIDIGMPRKSWENVEPILIREYLINNLKKALEQIMMRLKKEKIRVDEKSLLEDISKVEKAYLKPNPVYPD